MCIFFPYFISDCWAVCRQRIHSSLVPFSCFFVLTSGSSAYFFAAFSGSPYIPWQDLQSCSCYYIVSDICSCLWGGNASYVQAFIFLLPAHRLSDWSLHFDNQVIPQAICTRYGLAVGASFVWLVRIVMFIAYPIAYPIGKVNQQSHITQYKSFNSYSIKILWNLSSGLDFEFQWIRLLLCAVGSLMPLLMDKVMKWYFAYTIPIRRFW